jgi:hypothetical protein
MSLKELDNRQRLLEVVVAKLTVNVEHLKWITGTIVLGLFSIAWFVIKQNMAIKNITDGILK